MTRKRPFDRREFVKGTLTAGAVVTLAGCNTFGDGAGDSGDDENATGDSDGGGRDGPLGPGDEVEGELTDDAGTDPLREEPAVPYEVEVTETQWVEISLSTDDIDPSLVLTDGGGNAVAQNEEMDTPNSRLTARLSPGETYTVWVGSVREDETGNFTLSVSGALAAAGGEETSIDVGETVTGSIGDAAMSDPVRRQPSAPYLLEVSENGWVEITQESDAFDSYLVVTDDSGELVAENDDGAGSRDSELQTSLSAGVTYTVWAGSFERSGTGNFSLSVAELDEAKGDVGGSISVGDTVGGTIGPTSPTDPIHEEPAVPYDLAVDEEQQVEIGLLSDDIDCYLLVTDGDGTLVAEDDDSGAGTDSRIITTLAADETYTVWAGSFSAWRIGPFTLTVSNREAQRDGAESIAIGDVVTGAIRADSLLDPVREELAVPYTLAVSEERAVEIALRSDVIDTYLVLTDETGALVAEDDDSDDSGGSLLTATLSPDETYTVWAGSFFQNEMGPFTLSVSTAEGPMVDHVDSITVGETVTGEIREGSPHDPIFQQPAVPYSLEISEKQTVEIVQQSDDVDSYLSVTDGDGALVAADDDSAPTQFDALVSVTVAPNFDYTIWAGSYELDELGPFTLSVDSVDN